MSTQWWSYSPEDGWLSCREQEARQLLGMIESDADGSLEGCKVACTDGPIPQEPGDADVLRR